MPANIGNFPNYPKRCLICDSELKEKSQGRSYKYLILQCESCSTYDKSFSITVDENQYEQHFEFKNYYILNVIKNE